MLNLKRKVVHSVNAHKRFNRDLSWLSFNYRVLEEAKDESLPLYERIKFFAIFSSNLDEFYKVRVASYRSLMDLSPSSRKNLKVDPEVILRKINQEVTIQLEEIRKIFNESILPELEKNNIILHQEGDLNDLQKNFINRYFYAEVLPYIQPALLVKGKVLNFLQDNVIYLAVRLVHKSKSNKQPKKKVFQHAIIKLPSQYLPRFIKLPENDGKYHIIFLDDVIRYMLDVLFPGYNIDSCHSILLTRDADLLIEDEFHGDLVEKIRRSLSKRKTGRPSRFLYDGNISKPFLKILQQVFNLDKSDLVPGTKYHHLSDFFGFPNPLSPKLENEPMPPLAVKELEKYDSMFEALKAKDWMLHFPFQSFDYVINLFNQAAVDPKVEVIKTTQYRVASNSSIVSALISAARNGKDVTVFVEYKARFDEELNLILAERMKAAGIKIIHSIPGIKVHGKVALVLRKSNREKRQRGYAFVSTGNFNEKTAKLYSDQGFLTSKDEIIDELSLFFRYLEDQSVKCEYKKLLVAQFNMRDQLRLKIDREITNAKIGVKAHIILKLNSLEERKMIEKLYEASLAGVKIDLIIRGICCIVPDQPYSENINLIRIVDRFLEHSRIYSFYNSGDWDLYIASADWMERNLYRRIEIAMPIENKEIKQEILDILNIQLKDNVKARKIDANLKNVPFEPKENETLVRSQMETYLYLKNK